MRFLVFLFVSISIFSCKKVENPGYLKISQFSFQNSGQDEGPLSTNIHDAWVYIDDNLIGTFELPCLIPLEEFGNHQISISPGILINGENTLRSTYVFYEHYKIDTLIREGETIYLEPTTRYKQGLAFPFKADFDNSLSPLKASAKSDVQNGEIISDPEITWGKKGGSFRARLNSSQGLMQFFCQEEYLSLPKQGALLYLEFDYISSHDLNLQLESYYPASGSSFRPLATLDASRQWKKVYIPLTEKVSIEVNSQKQRLAFEILKQGDTPPLEFLIDNIKILHFKS